MAKHRTSTQQDLFEEPPPSTRLEATEWGRGAGALLTAWFKKYPDTLLTKEFLLAGAIELLQTRAAVLQPLKDVVLRSVHNVNSYTPNVARMYQIAGAAALLDEDEETGPDFDELTDTLEMELFTVMKSAEESLAAVISKWTHIVIEFVDQKSVSSRQIAKWVMDALAGQREAAADKPVRFTDAMEKELIKASHDFTFRTLHKICEQHGLRMLVVSVGMLLIDVEDGRTFELRPNQGLTVPKGVVHRTRAPERTAIMMFESATVTPTGGAMHTMSSGEAHSNTSSVRPSKKPLAMVPNSKLRLKPNSCRTSSHAVSRPIAVVGTAATTEICSVVQKLFQAVPDQTSPCSPAVTPNA